MAKRSDHARMLEAHIVDGDPQDVARLVVRKCRVCEWDGEVIEGPGPAPDDCPWCHGPTDVIRTGEAPAASAPDQKNPHAAALGRLGGLKGGPARAATLTPKQRRSIAFKAAQARWNKEKKLK
jgi:hypothetical protein